MTLTDFLACAVEALQLLVFYVAWSLSLGYTVSARALAAVQALPAAQSP